MTGRVPSEPGSRPADQAPSGLDAPRFDPSRFDAEMMKWLRACQPEPDHISGSDFSQGVVRGFEIVIAQIENGHHWKYVAPPLSSEQALLLDAAGDLYAACAEFVRKVEAGEARSSRSYRQMKAALAKADPASAIEARQGGDREDGRHAKHESAVPKADAQKDPLVEMLRGCATALDHADAMSIKPTAPSHVETTLITTTESRIIQRAIREAAARIEELQAENLRLKDALGEAYVRVLPNTSNTGGGGD